jgi:hypothetical protein
MNIGCFGLLRFQEEDGRMAQADACASWGCRRIYPQSELGLFQLHYDAMEQVTRYIVIVLISFFSQYFSHLELHGQPIVGIVEFEPEVYENTITQIYNVWFNSDASLQHEIDTILCTFIADFDSIDFRKGMNVSTLIQALRLRKATSIVDSQERELCIFKKKKTVVIKIDSLYACNCEIFDIKLKKVATIDSQQGYYIFQRFKDIPFGNDHLKYRLEEMKNLIVLRPSSNVHTFNYKWRIAIDQSGNLVWYHLDRPEENYSSEEVYQKYLDDLIL